MSGPQRRIVVPRPESSGQRGVRGGLRRRVGRCRGRYRQRPAFGKPAVVLPVRVRVGVLRLPAVVGGDSHFGPAVHVCWCDLGRYYLDHGGVCLGVSGQRGVYWADRAEGAAVFGRVSGIFLLHVLGLADSVVLRIHVANCCIDA